ncbi:MAG: hypothetical protein AVDCRST_MAG12-1171 [uncultured Rubrobacteraceae bacterium]|uniref:Uncharacterized protein n=1 Tax=uncultured Rubrobacteraceae bacterium TaxID=349277 RepID=A0A6J4RKS0_9ACTN|nr:MAG: hypothetical protein AVDCRST_MAG12-1171 [uncultured Rubrobacteraceae bacterium]
MTLRQAEGFLAPQTFCQPYRPRQKPCNARGHYVAFSEDGT